jgi:hypothetical protein
MDEDYATTTLPPPLLLGITVTAFLCVTAAHYKKRKKLWTEEV